CWRLRNQGHKIMMLPASTVFHLGGAIIKYGSPAKVYRNHRNNLIMLIKNLPVGALRWKLPLRFLLDYIAFAKMLADGHPKAAMAVFRAHLDILRQWSRWWQKRTATQQAATRYNTACIYPRSLIVAYFLRGKRTFRALNWRADNAR
ncbi:MAG: glycosyltransferase family 2 protein, partial [Bacteroidota bacterium]